MITPNKPSTATEILVVDDEPVVRHVCQLSLEQNNYVVVTAENGMKALEKLRSAPEIAIVLSDLKMPGMTGMDLLQAIKRDFPHIEVIIMTGYATIENAIMAMRLGAYDFLLKPLKPEQIQMVINKCCEKIALSQENLALKKANEKLRELQAAKDKFMAITSHELRTPVSHLKGYLSLLNEEYYPILSVAEKNECMRVINTAVLDLEQIVNDMVDLAGLEQGTLMIKREDTNINELLEQILQEFRLAAKERRQTLIWHPGPQSLTLYIDRMKVKSMVAELVQNAIKFTPDGGTIDLSLHQENDFCVITVRDSGVGIAQDDLGKIFEKFYEVQSSDHHSSSKTGFLGGGLGLGLSLARAIAEAHDGGIKVSSQLNQGSTFQIYLPLKQKSEVDGPYERHENVITNRADSAAAGASE
ncbi:MAG: response regulator [candidate division KSB1 bacterium]|nr:response regulator [candidate division KSB1 bacterium]MDZ7304264.1 response regulator [candidate division KSB1 bacterium]MDZ7312880.1 response regulator [candidate division KSB1 bacterium]